MPVLNGKVVTLAEWQAFIQERNAVPVEEPAIEEVVEVSAPTRKSKRDAAAQVMAALGIEGDAEAEEVE